MWDDEETSFIEPTAEEMENIPEIKYEYLDHPADVQIHAWGADLREAYEQAAMGMFGYMTEAETVDIVEVREVEAEAEDLQGLLFHFLDECLFQFSCEPFFIARKVVITDWVVDGVSDGDGGEVGKEGKGEEKGIEKKEGSEGGGGGDQNEGEGGASSGGDGGSSSGGGGGTGGEATNTMKIIGSGLLRVRARLFGEEFQLDKHPQGTEVKAITYASMQVYDKPGQHEVFVIVDI